MSSEQMSAGRRSEVSAVSGDLDRTRHRWVSGCDWLQFVFVGPSWRGKSVSDPETKAVCCLWERLGHSIIVVGWWFSGAKTKVIPACWGQDGGEVSGEVLCWWVCSVPLKFRLNLLITSWRCRESPDWLMETWARIWGFTATFQILCLVLGVVLLPLNPIKLDQVSAQLRGAAGAPPSSKNRQHWA